MAQSCFGRRISLVSGALALLLCVAAMHAPAPAAAEPLEVAVSTPPQAWFVRAVGRERVRVSVVLPEGVGMRGFVPSEEQLDIVARAHVYCTIGAPFEDAVLARLAGSDPGPAVVDMARGLVRAGDDPYVWMSPAAARTIAEVVKDALTTADPEGAERYAGGYARLYRIISDMDGQVLELSMSKGLFGRPLLAYGPVLRSFVAAYGFQLITPDIQSLDAEELADLARERGAAAVYVGPWRSPGEVRELKRLLDGRAAVVDPLAGDWLASMSAVIDALH